MKAPLLPATLAALCVVLLASCVDPNYYGGYAYYGSSSYTTMPYGYQTVYVGGFPYYYYGSRWYRYHGGRYVSCARPHGYHGSIGRGHHHHSISRLPHGCRTVDVGGHRYYTHGDSWYRKSGSRYVSCPRPSGYKHYDRHDGYKHHDGRDGYKSDSRSYRHKSDDSRQRSYHHSPEDRQSHERNRHSGDTGSKSHKTYAQTTGSDQRSWIMSKYPGRTSSPSGVSYRSGDKGKVYPVSGGDTGSRLSSHRENKDKANYSGSGSGTRTHDSREKHRQSKPYPHGHDHDKGKSLR